MAYTKTTWVNDESPDIDADNLNKMEQGIYDAQYPSGGTTGQYLKKGSSGPEWSDVDALPSGGTTGQVLKKTADGAEWADETGTVESVNNIEPDGNKNVQTQVTLTQAQYDALVQAGTVDPNVMYLITDGTVDYPTASTMAYDNSVSGLSATNVQDAIDEVNAKIASTKYEVTVNSSYTSNVFTNQVFKLGKMVIFNVGFVASSAISNGESILTVPFTASERADISVTDIKGDGITDGYLPANSSTVLANGSQIPAGNVKLFGFYTTNE